jgi:hypothetical protein
VEDKDKMTVYGDRRLGIERRCYDYSGYFPERRELKKDRRNGVDRRVSYIGPEDCLNRRNVVR